MSTNQAGISGTTKACSPPLKELPTTAFPNPKEDSQTEGQAGPCQSPADPHLSCDLRPLQTLSGHQEAPLLFGEVFHSDNQ